MRPFNIISRKRIELKILSGYKIDLWHEIDKEG